MSEEKKIRDNSSTPVTKTYHLEINTSNIALLMKVASMIQGTGNTKLHEGIPEMDKVAQKKNTNSMASIKNILETSNLGNRKDVGRRQEKENK